MSNSYDLNNHIIIVQVGACAQRDAHGAQGTGRVHVQAS